jgi:hypothetical protein
VRARGSSDGSRPVVAVKEDPMGDMIVIAVLFDLLRAIAAPFETGVGAMNVV